MLISTLLSDPSAAHLVELLQEGGVFTVERLLSTEDRQLQRLSNHAWNARDVAFLKQFLAQRCCDAMENKGRSPCSVRVDLNELFDHRRYFTHLLSCGMPQVDAEYLSGGLRTGEIVEVCGNTGTGKTQICLSACADAVVNSNSCVLYIDTCNSFHPERMSQILENRLRAKLSDEEQEDQGVVPPGPGDLCRLVEKGLSMIQVARVSDVQALGELFCTLVSDSKKRRGRQEALRLLVLDSITPLLLPAMGGGKYNTLGYGVLSRIAQTLRDVAVAYGLAVLITNSVARDPHSLHLSLKPSLGLSWAPVPDARLLVEAHENLRARGKVENQSLKIRLIKSRSQMLPDPATHLLFRVTPAGVERLQ